jgi:hypothetical protein
MLVMCTSNLNKIKEICPLVRMVWVGVILNEGVLISKGHLHSSGLDMVTPLLRNDVMQVVSFKLGG